MTIKQSRNIVRKWPFLTVKDKLREYFATRWMQDGFRFVPLDTRPKEEACTVFHPEWGRLGELFTYDLGDKTRLTFSKPFLPSQDEPEVKKALAFFVSMDLFAYEREQENERFYSDLLKSIEAQGKKSRKSRRIGEPQRETLASLEELRKIRMDAIKGKRPIPTKEAAMRMAAIDRKTWKKHDPELYKNWELESYKKE